MERSKGTPAWVWVLIGCVGVPVGITVIGIVAGLVVVLLPKGQAEADTVEDMNRLRRLSGLVVMQEKIPLAPDGRIDVYKTLVDVAASDREDLCFSSRAGTGATAAQIEAGDYSGFPWMRRRGRPPVGRRVLLLWEKEPVKGQRVVAWSDSIVKIIYEDEFQELLEATDR